MLKVIIWMFFVINMFFFYFFTDHLDLHFTKLLWQIINFGSFRVFIFRISNHVCIIWHWLFCSKWVCGIFNLIEISVLLFFLDKNCLIHCFFVFSMRLWLGIDWLNWEISAASYMNYSFCWKKVVFEVTFKYQFILWSNFNRIG